MGHIGSVGRMLASKRVSVARARALALALPLAVPLRRAMLRMAMLGFTLLSLALSVAGCGWWAVWEPADIGGTIPMPPPPKDSVESSAADPFGDDDDDAQAFDGDGLIPRKVLFGNPAKTAPQISPDGKHIAFIAPRAGVLNIWVAPAGDIDKARPITDDDKRGIRGYKWAYTNRDIVYRQDKGGDENWRVYAVDITTHKRVDLSAIEGVRTELQHVSHKIPNAILLGINDRDKRYHDVYRVELGSGKRTLLQKNEGYGRFVTDDDYNVRFAVKPTDDGGTRFLINRDGQLSEYARISMEDSLTTSISGFDGTGRYLYMRDSRGRDTAAFTRTKLPDGKPEVISHDAKADHEQALVHPTTKQTQATAVNHLRRRWRFFDDAVERDFALLAKVKRGDIAVVSRTLDDRRWIVSYSIDVGPTSYHLFDRTTKKTTKLFVSRPELEGLELARMVPAGHPVPRRHEPGQLPDLAE